MRHRGTHRNPLLLAAGEGLGPVVRAGAEPDAFQQSVRDCEALAGRCSEQLQLERDAVAAGEVG